ncbi:MAG: DUF1887 family protein [Bacteroidetes bacterium]|nr:DUF1887 family protein [Bacteroidota bacterium]
MVLVSIVSEQTIPNVLLIKEKRHEVDTWLFVTTAEMEARKKTAAIIEACQLPAKSCKTRLIDTNNLANGMQKLRAFVGLFPADTRFLVNITGGTKLLSMLVYSSFPAERSEFIYLPLGQPAYLQLNPQFRTLTVPLTVRLNLDEYLTACGLLYNNDSLEPFFDANDSEKIFRAFRQKKFQLENFPLKMAQDACKFKVNPENLPGTWFEDYVYHNLRKLDLDDQQIGRSVFIYTQTETEPANQEVDFVFVMNNTLHMLELKVSKGKSSEPVLNDIMKMSALRQKFGLNVQTYVITLGLLRGQASGKFFETMRNKIKFYNLYNIADKTDFMSGTFDWKSFFTNKIQL